MRSAAVFIPTIAPALSIVTMASNAQSRTESRSIVRILQGPPGSGLRSVPIRGQVYDRGSQSGDGVHLEGRAGGNGRPDEDHHRGGRWRRRR